MKLFFILFNFSVLLNAAHSSHISFTPYAEGFKIVGTRIENISLPLDPYTHLSENRERLEKLLVDRKNCENDEERINQLLIEYINHPYGLLQECVEDSCLLRRTSESGYRDKFFNSIKDKFFPVLRSISETINDGMGIDLSFLGSGDLLIEAQIIEAMLKEKIKIKTVYLIDKKYDDLTSAFKKSSALSFNIASPSFLYPNISLEEGLEFLAKSNLKPGTVIRTSYNEIHAVKDWQQRFQLLQLLQFRNYITKYNQAPEVVIFDSAEKFIAGKTPTHLFLSVDVLPSEIYTQGLIPLVNASLFTGILWNDGGHINAVEKFYDANGESQLLVTRYNL
jgi:hypothetical protein